MAFFKNPKYKNLQLTLSAIVVISVSFVYGGNPSVFLPYVFGFDVTDIDLKNIFRAIMGLYLAIGCFWIYGIRNKNYWESATLVNILFMGGLALGRLVSTILDGISPQFMVGFILEFIFMLWGIYNLRQHRRII
ncbi:MULTISPECIES: DUF4345 domain-containing protein [Cellulophaga]|jgi:hypothetical protein|uniref:Uncharacterized protein n=2 Tax=Cellulophaga baltica TaxID=76594 RepID=A0A1G7KCS1_9FLAO|nr:MULTISPECIES: DUF4345 domain-containing protein [Cellulophaga]WFO16250.1 DUF4345 domain-containing protein [Cellulophaga baltica 4]AIY14929.1 hypothetical protein M667_18140 [Cellulophaga baltica NN016038]AIZ43300.1 hypothetical protein M666_18140 [Cellulophaga baltica 18]KGK30349.1 hypothetical protein EL45_10445 [Cellulophaga sp. E6(2014)]MBA6316643.1 DUF4345 domain-containing protein [Cellulophaga baltica]